MADIWVGFAGIFIGALLGAGLGELREWRKDKRQERRVAIALISEIQAQADMVATCASIANYAQFEIDDHQNLKTDILLVQLPPEPSAYRSLASQLPLLDVEAISAVVAFYGGVERAKRLTSQHEAKPDLSDFDLLILGDAWRAASGCALFALQKLGEYDPPLKKPGDKAQLTELVTALAGVVSKKWPRVTRDKEGNFIFGRTHSEVVEQV